MDGEHRQRLKVRKALAWSACHKIRNIWTSTLKKDKNQTVYCYRRISSTIWCGNVDNNTNYEKATVVTLECYRWPLISHRNNTYRTYNYMVNYRQYPSKYNKEECGSLGIGSDTVMKSPTHLSCGSQLMDMQTGEGKK